MMRLLPYVIALAAGFIACAVFVRRDGPGGSSTDWERKYREILQRYRDLTTRLEHIDKTADLKASRLRQTLVIAAGHLREEASQSNGRASTALEIIEAGLKEN